MSHENSQKIHSIKIIRLHRQRQDKVKREFLHKLDRLTLTKT